MGLVYVDAVAKRGGGSKRVRLLVDSGVTHTALTRSVWEELGLEPLGEMEFVLADETVIRLRSPRLSSSCPATARGTHR